MEALDPLKIIQEARNQVIPGPAWWFLCNVADYLIGRPEHTPHPWGARIEI